MRIGNVLLKNNVFLAPMAGITDMAFRILCKRQGAGLVYPEMVSAKAIHHNSENTKEMLNFSEEEEPLAVQIFGHDPDILAETAKYVVSRGAKIIDINMGCPAPKIIKNKDGCSLMRDPDLVRNIIRTTVKEIDIPLTVKIRKGWDENSVNALEIATIAQEEGASAVTVHGRTREQFYTGKADWDIIKQVKNELSIPVIGNGDVFSPEDAKQLFEHTGCDAIMIARGAQGDPWIFKRVLEYLENGNVLPEPEAEEKIYTIIKHMKMLMAIKGEIIAVKEMRKHIGWYLKGLPNSSAVKNSVNTLVFADEVENTLLEYLNNIILL